MTLAVSLDVSQDTNSTLEFASIDAVCVNRPLAMGADANAVLVARNGEIEFSYSPKYNHYWFSKCPDESWFDDFYRRRWRAVENPQFESPGLLSRGRAMLRPLAKRIKNRFARYTNVDGYALDAINLFTVLRPYLPSDASTVLEVGCGPGFKMIPFLRDGHTCVGIEPSQAMSEAAKSIDIRTVNSPVIDRPEIREAFQRADVIFSNHSLEHHWNPRTLIELASKYMKPEAALSVSVPNGQAGFGLLQHIFVPHLDCYSLDSLEHLLSSFGFRCVHKSVSTQLRVVAIKGVADTELVEKTSTFDESRFRAVYANKFLKELRVEQATPGGRFDIECRGASPFRGLDYEVSASKNAVTPGWIRLRGRVSHKTSENRDSIVTYVSDDGKPRILVK